MLAAATILLRDVDNERREITLRRQEMNEVITKKLKEVNVFYTPEALAVDLTIFQQGQISLDEFTHIKSVIQKAEHDETNAKCQLDEHR